jgi:hypothetical protein
MKPYEVHSALVEKGILLPWSEFDLQKGLFNLSLERINPEQAWRDRDIRTGKTTRMKVEILSLASENPGSAIAIRACTVGLAKDILDSIFSMGYILGISTNNVKAISKKATADKFLAIFDDTDWP